MSNLDDFFKKRDKKKKPTTKKFVALDTEELSKQLEANVVEDEFDENNGAGNSITGERTGNQQNGNENMDEEWKPFDSDENRDYTGLKIIQNWKAKDQDSDDQGEDDGNERKPACPWGANQAQAAKNDETSETVTSNPVAKETEPQSTVSKTEVKETKEEIKEPVAAVVEKDTKEAATAAAPTAVKESAYIPPHLRNQAATTSSDAPKTTPPATSSTDSSGKYIPPSMRAAAAAGSSSSSASGLSGIPTTSVNYRRPNKAQPNINDTMEFPTLDAAVEPNPSEKLTNGSEKFEVPKKSGRLEPKSNENMIDLGNKFNALSASNN